MTRKIWRRETLTFGGSKISRFYECESDALLGGGSAAEGNGPIVEAMIAVPISDLRSVWVLKPEDARGLPHPFSSGVYIEDNVAEFVIAAKEIYPVYLAKSGKWCKYKGPCMRFESAVEALTAARAAVEAARKEAAG